MSNSAKARAVATEWFVRMRDEDVSDADRAAFRAWLETDSAHADAYHELERLWAGLDETDRRPSPRIDELRAPSLDTPTATSRQSAAPLRRITAAASLVVAVLLGAYALSSPGLLAELRTAAGEFRTVTLADGSTLQLNSASAVSTDFAAKQRLITLHKGEVYLQVAKDPGRPLVVESGSGRVTALGTAFSVDRNGDAAEIVVTEHRVEVSTPANDTAIVAANERVRVSGGELSPVQQVDVQRALAWRHGRLVFDRTPLTEVLAEIERYRAGRIVVMDDAVRNIPVTGAFSTTRHDQALETIEHSLPVRLVRISDLLILVFADS